MAKAVIMRHAIRMAIVFVHPQWPECSTLRTYRGEGFADGRLKPRITVEPGKMGGKPCIRGLRFTVYDLASNLASGMTEEEILRDFLPLEKEDFRAVYEILCRERNLNGAGS
jgi:uncharacterized protein (DUF433 family)